MARMILAIHIRTYFLSFSIQGIIYGFALYKYEPALPKDLVQILKDLSGFFVVEVMQTQMSIYHIKRFFRKCKVPDIRNVCFSLCVARFYTLDPTL